MSDVPTCPSCGAQSGICGPPDSTYSEDSWHGPTTPTPTAPPTLPTDYHPTVVTQMVLAEISTERSRQESRWGQQDHPWMLRQWGYVTDAEAAKALVDQQARIGNRDWAGILTEEYLEAIEETDIVDARAELVQVAAVAVAAIESIDRNGR
jgi:hypothetical protein